MKKTKTYSDLKTTPIIGKKSVPLIIGNKSTASAHGKMFKKTILLTKNYGSNYTSIRKIAKG
jgi:hypothetical protein